MTTTPLRIESLGKTFKGTNGPVTALCDVSFALGQGETVALLGRNGAGKTTLMKIASGLLVPDTGSVAVDGRRPYAERAALRGIGSLLEGNRNLYWKLTPRENLAYFGVLKGMSRRRIAERSGFLLAHFDLESKENEPVQRLSRGMQQKLAVACTVLHEPPLMLLDEPTLGLDAASSSRLIEMIRELALKGMTILLSTHQLDVAESLADTIVILDKGRVVKRARKDELIRSFSRDCYQIRIEGPVPPQTLAALREHLGATVDADGRITVTGDSARLYAALDMLRPAPVIEIARHRADLAGIFLQITGGGNDR
jgi:ABC-2 type transport system ATP-binding protein